MKTPKPAYLLICALLPVGETAHAMQPWEFRRLNVIRSRVLGGYGARCCGNLLLHRRMFAVETWTLNSMAS
jgi:hypothetical protein